MRDRIQRNQSLFPMLWLQFFHRATLPSNRSEMYCSIGMDAFRLCKCPVLSFLKSVDTKKPYSAGTTHWYISLSEYRHVVKR